MQVPFLSSTPTPPKWLPHTQTLLTEGSLSYRVAIIAGSALTVLVYTIIRDTLHHSKEAFNTLTGRNVQVHTPIVSKFLAEAKAAKEAIRPKAEAAKKAMISAKNQAVDFTTKYKMEMLKGFVVALPVIACATLGFHFLGRTSEVAAGAAVVSQAANSSSSWIYAAQVISFGLIIYGVVGGCLARSTQNSKQSDSKKQDDPPPAVSDVDDPPPVSGAGVDDENITSTNGNGRG